jgi:hypothetical protein
MRRALLLVTIITGACTTAAEEKARAATAAAAGIAAESAKAVEAASLPATGLWDEPRLLDRLVHAGLAPRPATGAPAPAGYWERPATTLQLGDATLIVFFYPDSMSRRRITGALNDSTIAPKGTPGPFPLPHLLIVNNNLAAVLVGATDRAQERIMLAITAGLAAPK